MDGDALLRQAIRDILEEDLKNVRSKHKKTVTGSRVLKKIHDTPGMLKMLSTIKDPMELAQVIQAIDDVVPMASTADIETALKMVLRHEQENKRK